MRHVRATRRSRWLARGSCRRRGGPWPRVRAGPLRGARCCGPRRRARTPPVRALATPVPGTTLVVDLDPHGLAPPASGTVGMKVPSRGRRRWQLDRRRAGVYAVRNRTGLRCPVPHQGGATMRAAVLHECPGWLDITDLDVGAIGPSEVLVQHAGRGPVPQRPALHRGNVARSACRSCSVTSRPASSKRWVRGHRLPCRATT